MFSRKKATVFLIAIWALVVIAGYFKANNESTEEGLKPTQTVSSGFTHSKKPTQIGKTDPGIQTSYELQDNETFSGFYHILSLTSEKKSYLLLTFNNYEQIPVYLDEKKSLTHLVSVPAESRRDYKFRAESLSEGFQDYFMILIWSPFNLSLREEVRLGTDNDFYSDQRASLIIKNANPQKFEPNTFGKVHTNKEGFNGFIINKSSEGRLEYWIKEKKKKGTKINYYVQIGNAEKKLKNFALIALLDYKQVPLASGKKVLFGSVNPNSRITVPATIKTPMEKGVHELLVFMIDKPYTKRPPKKSEEAFMPSIHSSIRVPIIIE